MAKSQVRIALIVAALVLLQALLLTLEGHPLVCRCGVVALWEGNIFSSQNSQQFFDWYSFSHVLHGVILYLALWYLFPRMSVGRRFLIAICAEVAWEILENTPVLIDHYRQQALAQGYVGDSIINSVTDTLCAIFGFLVARRLPLWGALFLALGIEVVLGYEIRDNLTLTIMNFIHQFDFIRAWQAGLMQ